MANENNAKKSPRRRLRWLAAVLAGMCALVLLVGGILQSQWFHELIGRRLTEALEKSTGARVAWEDFTFDPWRLEINFQKFILHGREGPQEPPLFSAERIEAQWTVISIWDLRADLARLRVSSPRISIAVSSDGRSNLPLRPQAGPDRGAWGERIFALRVRRLEALRGEFRWNGRRRPFDFRAENMLAVLDSEGREGRFAGRLDYQNAALTFGNAAPLLSQTQTKFFLYPNRVEIESLEWRTARSHLSAQGVVEDFRSPRVQARYQLQLDLREA